MYRQFRFIFNLTYSSNNIKSYMSISYFAENVNMSICEYLDKVPIDKANKEKKPIHFLKGDPTAYGNSTFRMPEAGYQVLRKNISIPDNHGYTSSSGVPAAREAILKLYKPKINITAKDVVIQHGVNQGLLAALLSFTNPGDEILVPETGYPIFQKLAPSLKVTPISYKLKEKTFQIDLQHVKTLITPKTQFIFIINPSNPMGTLFSLEHMEQILKFCDKNQLPILADQVYHGQVYPGQKFYSFGDVTQNVPVIVLSGVQKLFSVPGWCTSWSVVFDKHKYLQTVWGNVITCGMTFLHSNTFTQKSIPELIEKELYVKQEYFAQIKQTHDYLESTFNGFNGYSVIRAQGTIYQVVLIDVEKFKDIKNDKAFTEKLMIEENIVVIPLTVFGGTRNGFRMITCAKKEIYEQFFERIKAFNERHQK